MSEPEFSAEAAGLNFAHFRVERHSDGSAWQLGSGAMGVTYKAWDEKLRLTVALKVIAPAQAGKERAQALFLREARAAARVRHQNVASVLALSDTPGNLYYAMEFIDGTPLSDRLRGRGPLPTLLALDLAGQIAHGLEAIHEQHLIHRDLKPANLMLLPVAHAPGSEAWRVKIIDFGLARETDAHSAATDETAAATIGFRGTSLYASPEQCEERRDLDARSDLYALGCILWEMLLGTTPFRAKTHRELLNLHVSAPPPLVRLAHLPASVQAIVARLLLKDRDARFADAGALAKALEGARQKIERGEDAGGDSQAGTIPEAEATIPLSPAQPVAAAAPVSDKSIAVLPFTNMSEERENAFFTEGVHEDILTHLALVRAFRVVSRTSVQLYRASGKSMRQIARELGVTYILEGSVRRAGNKVRVTGQLIRAASDENVWAQSFDRDLTDVFAIQSEIAQQIAAALRAVISPQERDWLAHRPTTSPAAYDLFLKAREIERNGDDSAPELWRRVGLMEQATQLDPAFADGWGELATALSQLRFGFHDMSDALLARAQRALDRAEALAPDRPIAAIYAASFHYCARRDYLRALAKTVEFSALQPQNSLGPLLQALIQRRQGRWAESVANLRRAQALDPASPEISRALVLSFIALRRYDEALVEARRRQALLPAPTAEAIRTAQIHFYATGDASAVEELLARAPAPQIEPAARFRLLEAAFQIGDLAAVARIARDFPIDPEIGVSPIRVGVLSALAEAAAGRLQTAQAAAASLRDRIRAQLLTAGDNPVDWASLAFVLAILGRRTEALAAAYKACDLVPGALDALASRPPQLALASVQAWSGEADAARDAVPQLLTQSGFSDGSINVHVFRRSPLFQPLGNDPRFDAILAETRNNAPVSVDAAD